MAALSAWLTEALVEHGRDVTLFASGDSVTVAKLKPIWPRAFRVDGRIRDPIAPAYTDAPTCGGPVGVRPPSLSPGLRVLAADLGKKYSNAGDAEIVNYFETAYCPLVAREAALSGAEKRARMDRFSSQVEQIIKAW